MDQLLSTYDRDDDGRLNFIEFFSSYEEAKETLKIYWISLSYWGCDYSESLDFYLQVMSIWNKKLIWWDWFTFNDLSIYKYQLYIEKGM